MTKEVIIGLEYYYRRGGKLFFRTEKNGMGYRGYFTMCGDTIDSFSRSLTRGEFYTIQIEE